MKKVSLLATEQPRAKVYKTLSALTLLLAGALCSNAWSDTLDQAKRIHERLTGVPPNQTDLTEMANRLGTDPTGVTAAQYAVDTSSRRSEFYTTRLKNFFVQYTNIDDDPLPFLNDAAATMIGMVRDGVPFDQVLYGDLLYVPAAGYSRTSNANYEAMDRNHADLSNTNVLRASTQSANSPSDAVSGTPGVAGVLTTRAWGEAYYSAGTNRRVTRSITMNFLCRDLEEMKDTTLSPDRIRQDVTRSPGGDSSIFLSSCIGCHTGMDPMTGAFAYYEWVNDHLAYSNRIQHDPANGVLHKYLINSGNFPEGYVTRDDNWENYWREGKNAALGWGLATPSSGSVAPASATTATGNGPQSVGREYASTKAFAVCQVERVYKDVCRHEPISDHNDKLKTLETDFMTSFDMKDVFVRTAAMCKGN